MSGKKQSDEFPMAGQPALWILIMCVLTLCQGLHAQRLEWSVDFNTVFDNREGDNKMTDTKTFFQTQLAPEIGVSVKDGMHRIMGGVVWTQPIGCEWNDYNVSPTLYYRYKGNNGWSMAMGMFPRTLMHRRLPNYVWSDSVNYSQRNIRGVMATYVGRDGYFEGIVDWRAMQRHNQREAFNIFAHGEWQRPGAILQAGGVAVMNHLARSKPAFEYEHVVDNFIVNPYIGFDFTENVKLDSLDVRVGALGSLTRNRGDGVWKTPVGLWLDVTLEWKMLGWHNTTYVGGKMFPYYSEFGSVLDQGEPYYRSDWYNRTSLYGYLIRDKWINLQASLDFNVAKDNFTFYQRLILRVYIDCNYKKLASGYKLKSAFQP